MGHQQPVSAEPVVSRFEENNLRAFSQFYILKIGLAQRRHSSPLCRFKQVQLAHVLIVRNGIQNGEIDD